MFKSRLKFHITGCGINFIRLKNIVSFKELNKVRGGIESVPESNLQQRREKLAAWETSRIKQGGLATQEGYLAQYTGNEALGQLVARNAKGEIAASDPLLVRIESEDINKTPSQTNSDRFFASSVRKFTLKIDVNNMDDRYRPLVIFYNGPEDINGETGAGRTSRTVTLELNADFKGILFAPNSPVVIKSNGHKIRGMVVGKSFRLSEDGQELSSDTKSFYKQFGFRDADVSFDDFELLDISATAWTKSNVILTAEQAKRL